MLRNGIVMHAPHDPEDDAILRDALCQRQPIRALIVGDAEGLAGYLAGIAAYCSPPFLMRLGNYFIDLPTQSGTLILSNVDALSPAGQRQCYDWLDNEGRGVAVLSTTTVPLQPLVARGLFLEALYYRLKCTDDRRLCID